MNELMISEQLCFISQLTVSLQLLTIARFHRSEIPASADLPGASYS
jgi:hypothetical protein